MPWLPALRPDAKTRKKLSIKPGHAATNSRVKSQSVPRPEASLSDGLRRFLYLTALVTGAAILVVEILGAKMLTPYLGTSHFVWTAQITVTLIALAAGYSLGGWWVDRRPELSRLYAILLVAAMGLCLTVVVREPVVQSCLRFQLAWGALLSSMVLFFVPLTLLATTGPFLVRVLTRSVASVGGQVGRISALSTLGSVAGTLLIGYIMLPRLSHSMAMYSTAGSLAVLAAIYFAAWGRRQVRGLPLIILVWASLGCVWMGAQGSPARWPAHLIERYRASSNFGLIQVLETADGRRRYYLNDWLMQNSYDTVDKRSASLFTYLLHGLAHAYTPRIDAALCIGLGVGCVPMDLARQGVRVDVVEINPSIVPVAERFFGLEPARLNITAGDGRFFINRSPPHQYDTIILDAFLGDSSPSHLMTREAFAAMRAALKPGGTLVVNSFVDFEPGLDFMAASLERTLRSVFQQVRIHDATTGNVFYVASDQADLQIIHPPDPGQVDPWVRRDFEAALTNLRTTRPESGRILTDDFNPVEVLDAPNREALRRRLAWDWMGS